MGISKELELRFIYERIEFIFDYAVKKYGRDPFFSEWRKIAKLAYEKKNLRGLKEMSRDIGSWIKSFDNHSIIELEGLLKEKFGSGLYDYNTISIIKNIIKRGYIINEDEYRLIYEIICDISENDELYEKISILENIIYNYGNK